MANIRIEPGDSYKLIHRDDEQKYRVQITGARVYAGRSKSEARTAGVTYKAGWQGRFWTPPQESLWFHNPGDVDEGDTAVLEVDSVGFFSEKDPRDVIAGVLTSGDNEAAPASDDFCWAREIGADPSATWTYTCEAPGRADTIRVTVDDANDAFEVAVLILDENDNEVTRIDKDDNGDMSGGIDNPSHTETAIFSPHVRVEITGAATSADISVYAQ